MRIVGWKRVPEALGIFLSFKGLIVFGLAFLSLTLSVFKWRFILETLTGRSNFKDLGKVWFSGFSITYLFTPSAMIGGEPFRIYFAKKRYNLDWKKSVASVLIERFLDWTIFLIFALIGFFAFFFYNHLNATKVVVFGFLIICFLIGLLFFFYFKALKKESTLIYLLKIFGIKKERLKNSHNNNIVFEVEKEMINFLSPKKKIFWHGIFLAFLKYFLTFLSTAFLVFCLSGGINVFRNFAIFGLNGLATLIPVPAALGSLEATSILSFKAVGLEAALGGIFAMVFRGADLINALIGLIFLFQFSIKSAGAKILEFFDKIKEE